MKVKKASVYARIKFLMVSKSRDVIILAYTYSSLFVHVALLQRHLLVFVCNPHQTVTLNSKIAIEYLLFYVSLNIRD